MTRKASRRKKPTLEALRALLAFHDQKQSVMSAARNLNLTQPVVSRKLKVFTRADVCGRILLAGSGNTLRLTEAALDVIPEIRKLLQDYDQLLGYLREESQGRKKIRIGVGSFSAQHYVPQAIASLRRQEPDIDVETQIARGSERIAGVLDSKLDLAVVSHDPVLIDELVRERAGKRIPLVVEALAGLELCVIARKKTAEGQELESIPARDTVPLTKLKHWELVGLDRNSGIRRQLERQLANPEELQFLSGGGWLAAKEFVRHNIGVAVVPLAVLSRADAGDFVIRRLADHFVVRHYLIHRQQPASAARDAVKQALHEAADASQAEVGKRWLGVV
jgi:DNA-binding transcriptional LysR family regulator